MIGYSGSGFNLFAARLDEGGAEPSMNSRSRGHKASSLTLLPTDGAKRKPIDILDAKSGVLQLYGLSRLPGDGGLGVLPYFGWESVPGLPLEEVVGI